MENSTNSADDISLGDLFPDGDYSSIFDDLQSSGALDLNDNNSSSFLTLLPSVNNDDSYSETTNGSTSSGSFRFSSDEQQDTLAIVDDGQMLRNSTFDQNPSTTNMLMPQKTIENQNVLTYQMNPSIFEGIDVTMSVKQQPKANNRLRYECDGVRFLPDSRHHPLAIHIRNLQHIELAKNQTLGIVMTIVTSTNNPKGQTIVHANDITYHDSHAIKIAYGCVFVPLRRYNDVEKFRRLSILYKKYSDYTFDLTPFDVNTMFGTTEKYTVLNDQNMEKVQKGKCFKRDYDLLSYKLIFQLALKENNIIYILNVTCETDVIREQVMTQESGKQTTSVSTESLLEDECNFETEISNSSKRFKSSTPPLIGLPVTRVSNQFINFDIDRQQ
ncbi:unnamed protein product [Rotaria sordida]|uniref:Uncharacterized protein n=1 Tax=Rotaria sordida TaxID=392033 RepID=A0A815QHU2_9BILA|nr:unnamed protein product [Rotaria sordida]CAF4095500.1 unnamed protein product [Rotaria sordida]